MKVQIEQAAEAFLTDRLGQIAALSGIDFEVRAATKKGSLSESKHTVICAIRSEPFRMRNLKDYELACSLASPANVATVTPDTVGAMQLAIQQAWEDTIGGNSPDTDWTAALAETLSGWTSGGLYPGSDEPENEDNNWMWSYVITIGILRDGA